MQYRKFKLFRFETTDLSWSKQKLFEIVEVVIKTFMKTTPFVGHEIKNN